MIYRLPVILLIATMVLAGCRTSKNPERGRDTREAVVNDFIVAIERGDPDVILELTNPVNAPTRNQIHRSLGPLLGSHLQLIELTYRTEFEPGMAIILLEGTSE